MQHSYLKCVKLQYTLALSLLLPTTLLHVCNKLLTEALIYGEPYLELRHRLREYEAPPPQVREHSLHEPQASHSVSLSSSDRAVRELCKPGEKT